MTTDTFSRTSRVGGDSLTIQDIHSDEALRRREFPVTAREAFFGNSAVCPLPARVGHAVADYAMEATTGDQELPHWRELYAETRRLAAKLLGCEHYDVAAIGPTSVGLSLVANGLPWQRGDNVIFYKDCYPSNSVVWQNLEKRGVEPRGIPHQAGDTPGKVTLSDLERLVDDKTRLVSLASANFVSGYALDINEFGKWLHARDVLFCVDGIQTVGAINTPVEHVDFLAADAHKWMLGPCGQGIFYVSREARQILEPTLLGWQNVVSPDFIVQDEVKFSSDARRYEAGSANILGIAAMHAGLQLLDELGYEAVFATVLGHTRYLREELRAKGYTLANPDDDHICGITAVKKDGVDPGAMMEAFKENNILASKRATRDGTQWLRFAPHVYNTRAELDKLLSLL
jgi:selenocysteine lyase/cysteine desulfurase